MTDLYSMAAFLRRHCDKLRAERGHRKREKLLMWLAWHSSRYDACAVENEQGKLVAVGVARAIHDPVEARTPYHSDEGGKILFVEQVAATTKEGFQRVLHYARKRWPNCTKIMFHRSKNGHQVKTYDFDTFYRRAML